MGYVIQFWYAIFYRNINKKTGEFAREIPVIVSLTSYGRRVNKTLPYALISLLKQSFLPDRIIVWLDNDNWSDDLLSSKLKFLQSRGVEFRYCENIYSYKKLVPSLMEFPEAIIITVDDDIFFRSNLLADLYNSYLKDTKSIHTALAHVPLRDASGVLLSYNSWPKNIKKTVAGGIFPTGGGGCLYPPRSLYKDVVKKELFLQLCPKADDVWFWVMAKLQSTKHIVVETKDYYMLDLFYELTQKGTALRHYNVYENGNDVQIKQVLNYYGLK